MEKRVLAGFLLFFGFLAIAVSIVGRFLEIMELGEPETTLDEQVLNELYLIAGLEAALAFLVVMGAMSSMAGWKWWLSMVGAVVCVLSMGAFLIASACGAIALVLLVMSRDEFVERVVYVDEDGGPYRGPYGGSATYEETYYDDGMAYEDPGAYHEAPAITLVDQYGHAEARPYEERPGRYA